MNKQINNVKNKQKQIDSKISHQNTIYLGGEGGKGITNNALTTMTFISVQTNIIHPFKSNSY